MNEATQYNRQEKIKEHIKGSIKQEGTKDKKVKTTEEIINLQIRTELFGWQTHTSLYSTIT